MITRLRMNFLFTRQSQKIRKNRLAKNKIGYDKPKKAIGQIRAGLIKLAPYASNKANATSKFSWNNIFFVNSFKLVLSMKVVNGKISSYRSF